MLKSKLNRHKSESVDHNRSAILKQLKSIYGSNSLKHLPENWSDALFLKYDSSHCSVTIEECKDKKTASYEESKFLGVERTVIQPLSDYMKMKKLNKKKPKTQIIGSRSISPILNEDVIPNVQSPSISPRASRSVSFSQIDFKHITFTNNTNSHSSEVSTPEVDGTLTHTRSLDSIYLKSLLKEIVDPSSEFSEAVENQDQDIGITWINIPVTSNAVNELLITTTIRTVDEHKSSPHLILRLYDSMNLFNHYFEQPITNQKSTLYGRCFIPSTVSHVHISLYFSDNMPFRHNECSVVVHNRQCMLRALPDLQNLEKCWTINTPKSDLRLKAGLQKHHSSHSSNGQDAGLPLSESHYLNRADSPYQFLRLHDNRFNGWSRLHDTYQAIYLIHDPLVSLSQSLFLQQKLKENGVSFFSIHHSSSTLLTSSLSQFSESKETDNHDITCNTCYLNKLIHKETIVATDNTNSQHQFTLAKIEALKHALANGYQTILLLSDAVKISKNWEQQIQNHLDEIPTDCTFLLMGAHHQGKKKSEDEIVGGLNWSRSASFYRADKHLTHEVNLAIGIHGNDTIQQYSAWLNNKNDDKSLVNWAYEQFPETIHVWFPNLFIDERSDCSIDCTHHKVGHLFYWQNHHFESVPVSADLQIPNSKLLNYSNQLTLVMPFVGKNMNSSDLCHLNAVLQSLQNQTFCLWSLIILTSTECFASDAKSECVEQLKILPAQDFRIKLQWFESMPTVTMFKDFVNLNRSQFAPLIGFASFMQQCHPQRLEMLLKLWMFTDVKNKYHGVLHWSASQKMYMKSAHCRLGNTNNSSFFCELDTFIHLLNNKDILEEGYNTSDPDGFATKLVEYLLNEDPNSLFALPIILQSELLITP